MRTRTFRARTHTDSITSRAGADGISPGSSPSARASSLSTIGGGKAESQAAQSKGQAARGCAKAYIGALGGLFEGDSVSAEAETVRKDLQGVTADCKDALAGV